MDFQKLITRYRQFGGFRLIREYAKLGALWPAVKAAWWFTVKGSWFKVGVFQCCKGLYGEVIRKVEPYLIERYGTQISQIAQNVSNDNANDNANANDNDASTPSTGSGSSSGPGSATGTKTIWWCWLQGLDAAPPIVKACYNSLKQLTGYSLVVIDNSNWREYVELPGYIVEKWEKGRIPAAMFSDLLRVELLIRYGGTWIDSTVLCTGVVNDNDNANVNLGSPGGSKSQEKLTQNLSNSELTADSKRMVNLSNHSTLNSQLKHKMLEYLDAPLFVFQYNRQGSGEVSISNWFITACRNNEVLLVLREMLHAYWKDYDCVLDYYMFHLFFAMIAKECPEAIAAMPYAQSQHSLVLLHHLGEKFDQRKWDRLTSQVGFHKLAFRVSESIKNDNENFYNYILRMA